MLDFCPLSIFRKTSSFPSNLLQGQMRGFVYLFAKYHKLDFKNLNNTKIY